MGRCEYMVDYNMKYNANPKNKEIRRQYNAEYRESLHPLYKKFYKMKERCSKNSTDSRYKLYRDRSIKVLFADKYEFKDWAIKNGWKDGYDIHRIDEYGHYEPNNCIFLPHDEHANHTNISNSKIIMRDDGMIYKSITECAKSNNTSIATMSRSIKNNKSVNNHYFTHKH